MRQRKRMLLTRFRIVGGLYMAARLRPTMQMKSFDAPRRKKGS